MGQIILPEECCVNLMEKWINKIHYGYCENIIPELPDESIDLVITSPPYNVENPYDLYQDNKGHQEFIAWLTGIFALLKYKMVTGGRVCINIADAKNGAVPTHSDIIQFMTKELRYLMKSTIIWDKSQIGNRTSWGSWKSPSNPSFPTPFEYILIFANEDQKREGKKELITVSEEEFIQNSLALWTFPSEQSMAKYGHPAMFPLELPYRLIQQLSYKDDVVADIFSGIGTTCLAAAMLDRRWFGIEMSGNYVRRSVRRIRNYTDQIRLFR